MASDLLTVKEAAAIALRTPWTIRAWLRTGKLRPAAMLPGQRPLISRAELEAFMGLEPSAVGSDPEVFG